MPAGFARLLTLATLVDAVLAGASLDQSIKQPRTAPHGGSAPVLAGAPERRRTPLLVAGGLSIAHTFTTARAAPINFSQRTVADDERALERIFDRFERWQAARAMLQLATFLAMLRALAVT